MTKATIIVDIHDVSILLSGVMMLENLQRTKEKLHYTGINF